MTATTLGVGGLSNNGLMFGPGLSLNIEGVNITESNASIVKTTMTTINVESTIVVASTGVSSGCGCVDRRLLILSNNFVTCDASPSVVGDFKPPAIIESLGWA